MNFEQITITVYDGVADSKGHEASLQSFLYHPDVDTINRLRASTSPAERSRLKKRLPQATIGGVFVPSRKADNLVKPSNLICIDIDHKDNLLYPHFDRLIHDVLSKLPMVAYAAHSVGGRGYFAIIPIADHQRHKLYFRSLQMLFKGMGIVIDRACSDICRLRCQSYDAHPYVNLDATVYASTVAEERKEIINRRFGGVPSGSDSAGYRKAMELCHHIAARGIDITANYDDWFTVGAALSTLGESGRELFHLCSRQNPHYSRRETDHKFSALMTSTLRITLGSFFYICSRFGIRG
jgi:hypothetical protein